MVGMEEFCRHLLYAVRKKAGGRFAVRLTESSRNNSVMRKCLDAGYRGSSIGLKVYLDEYYERYCNEKMNMEEIAEEVCGTILGKQGCLPEVSYGDFLKWDDMKGRISARLISTRMNMEMLKGVPSRAFLDLSVVYNLRLVDREGDVGSIMVDNRLLALWEKDEEALHEAALKNREEFGEACFKNVMEILSQAVGETADTDGMVWEEKMYFLTNTCKLWGASEILDTETLDKIAEQIGDFIVLPSSVHEVIIIPDNGARRYEELAALVVHINRTCLKKDEILSGSVYAYSKSDHALRIAA